MSEDVRRVALTTDIGEGFGIWRLGDDEALMKIVTAANVACGFHGGDPRIMRATCEMAAENAVAIGAQVSYRDLAGFGRRFVDADVDELIDDLLYQMGALDIFARLAGSSVSYVRAHGALYNAAATHKGHARAIVEATRLFDPSLPILCQDGTATWTIAQESGIRVVAEAFVDRAYTADGLLLPRTQPNALVTDPDEAAQRAVRMVTHGRITAQSGEEFPISAQALLVHSDTPGAVEVARRTRKALQKAGIQLSAQL
ncbi:LamB/YcsF family protein [Ornithinimicrobium cryptoxanthini]|uniref:LamB/YcsF family protein n=1 Tax=Ornithinimicrobium cryptoxanthini TaxID=2934161 RepID=A0ABY4YM70_9MICO|nr:5-oxoprolinase subunit PxpA [Ornithinimicrobium cryptoxanthini]USQ77829.1 LamB/YcsF family protein [Ornithinimicrobium cryptoxanthini]